MYPFGWVKGPVLKGAQSPALWGVRFMLAAPAGKASCGTIQQLPLPCVSWRIHWFPAVTLGFGSVAVTGRGPWDVLGPGVPTRVGALCSCRAQGLSTCHGVNARLHKAKHFWPFLKLDFNYFIFLKFRHFLVIVGLSTSSSWWLKAGVHFTLPTGELCKDTQASPSLPAYPNLLHFNISLPQVPRLPSLCDISPLQSRVTQCNGGDIF